MGKAKSPTAPEFQETESKDGSGNLVSRTYRDNGKVVTQYYEDPAVTAGKKAAQEGINSLLPRLGTKSDDMARMMQQTQDAYINQSTDAFNKIYDPALRNLREDIGSRFGTLKATPYLDQLNTLESNVRTPALRDIVNTGVQQGNNLYYQDQSNLANQLQGLGYTLNGSQQNFLNNLSGQAGTNQNANNFNLANYQNQLTNYQNQLQAQNSIWNSLAQGGMAGGMAMKFSDRRLKTNVVELGRNKEGFPVYAYTYVWGEPAIGCMADEVEKLKPRAVKTHSSGYKMVDYAELDMRAA